MPDIETELSQLPSSKTSELQNVLSLDLSSLNKNVSFDRIEKLGKFQGELGAATAKIPSIEDITSSFYEVELYMVFKN